MTDQVFNKIKAMLEKQRAISDANSKEELKKLLTQSIENKDWRAFTSVCDRFDDMTDADSAEPWIALFQTNNVDMIESISFDQKMISNMENAWEKYSRLTNVPHTAQYHKLKFQVKALVSRFYADCGHNVNESAISICSKNNNVQNYPDIMIDTENAVYRFSGIDRCEVEQKGLSTCIKQMVDVYAKDMNKRRILFQKNGNDNALSDPEEMRFSQNQDTPMQDIEKFLDKIDQIADICQQFWETPHAPLLDVFVQGKKAIAVSYKKTQRIGGVSTGSVLVLDKLKLPVLHHELIHAFDGDCHFSDTPLFGKVYSDCVDEAMLSMLRQKPNFWKQLEMFIHSYSKEERQQETPAYLASLSYESPYPVPPLAHSVVEFLSLYAKAVSSGNTAQQKMIKKSLQVESNTEINNVVLYINQLTNTLKNPVIYNKNAREM